MRKTPIVVSTRMTYGQRKRLERVAAELSQINGEPTTISDVLRSALHFTTRRDFDAAALSVGMRAVTDASPPTEKDRTDLCEFLGLPKDATDEEIREAIEALLFTAAPPEPAGATGGSADLPPLPTPLGRKPLSVKERDYCARHKITPEQFAARTRAAVRSTSKGAR